MLITKELVAGPTRLELATSGVTGRRSNQLNYDPASAFALTRLGETNVLLCRSATASVTLALRAAGAGLPAVAHAPLRDGPPSRVALRRAAFA